MDNFKICTKCQQLKSLSIKSNGKRLAVDHDHKTGEVRGLLCYQHNTALGKLGDNVSSIEIVLSYLKKTL